MDITEKGASTMNERPYPLYPEEEEPAPPDETLFTGAGTEMTGLIPAGRPDKDGRESYQDVLPWLPPFAEPQQI